MKVKTRQLFENVKYYLQIAKEDIKNEENWFDYLFKNNLIFGICCLINNTQLKKQTSEESDLLIKHFCKGSYWCALIGNANSCEEAVKLIEKRIKIINKILKND